MRTNRLRDSVLAECSDPARSKALVGGGKLRVRCRNGRILYAEKLGTTHAIPGSAQVLIREKNKNERSLSYEFLAESCLT